MAVTEAKGRTIKRWAATCAVVIHEDRRAPVACGFNERKNATLHRTAEAAVRESVHHLVDQHNFHGVREVTVRRVYAPRVVEREEVVE